MNQAEERLERMRNNPRDDWMIADVGTVCRTFDTACEPPTGGRSHYTVSDPSQVELLTVPAHKPIKVVYIVKLVLFIDALVGTQSNERT